MSVVYKNSERFDGSILRSNTSDEGSEGACSLYTGGDKMINEVRLLSQRVQMERVLLWEQLFIDSVCYHELPPLPGPLFRNGRAPPCSDEETEGG